MDVAAARSDERTHEGGGIVFHLCLHDVVHLLATKIHRMCRSGVGARSHRRNVSRLENEEAGRRRVGAAGGDIDDDGYRRRQNGLDDVARGIDQAPGCMQLDQDGIGIGLPGLLNCARNVLGADRLDGVVDLYLDDRGGEG